MRLRNIAGQCQQQRHRVLCCGDHVGLRSVRNHDAATRGCLDVDVVDADTRTCYYAQAIRLREQVGVDMCCGANQDAVELSDPTLQLGSVPASAQLNVEPRLPQ